MSNSNNSSSSFNPNPSSPIHPTPTPTPEIPQPTSHILLPVTPPPPPASPQMPLLEGPSGSSALMPNTTNQEMALVPFEGTEGGSESGAVVECPGSPAKQGFPEKEATGSGSGTGQGPSGSSAFAGYTTNQEMALVPCDGTGGGSESGGSPAKQGFPEKEAVATGSGTGQGPSDSSAFTTCTTNQEMALVPFEGTGGGSEPGALVEHSGSPDKQASASGSGTGQGSSSFYPNANNPSFPIRPSPRRWGEILNIRPPKRPRLTYHLLRPVTPPPPPSSPHRPLLQGPSGFETHSSAFGSYTPNQEMAIVPFEGTGGVSGPGALVIRSGSSTKRGRSEKKPAASGSGTGQGSEDESRKKCSICGKAFASEKAVFGHMRLHRDRGWRGAHPPPVFNAAEDFADVPGVNLPLVVREEVEGGQDGRATVEAAAEAAERAAAVEAEEAEKALAVERRRGIRIDLNDDLWTKCPDDLHNPDA